VFESSVAVNRITKVSHPNAIPYVYSADIRIRCKECKKEFEFVGLPMGSSFESPTISADGKELRAPIKPSESE
jgi:hypothetical protein